MPVWEMARRQFFRSPFSRCMMGLTSNLVIPTMTCIATRWKLPQDGYSRTSCSVMPHSTTNITNPVIRKRRLWLWVNNSLHYGPCKTPVNIDIYGVETACSSIRKWIQMFLLTGEPVGNPVPRSSRIRSNDYRKGN